MLDLQLTLHRTQRDTPLRAELEAVFDRRFGRPMEHRLPQRAIRAPSVSAMQIEKQAAYAALRRL